MSNASSITLARARRALREFGGHSAGVAALEFALMLPLLLLVYLTTFEASQAMDAHQKVDATASTVGNLVSRSQVMSDLAIGNIFDISGVIMVPFATEKLVMTVTTLRIDAAGTATVHWSKASEGTGRAAGTVYGDLPTDMKRELRSTYVVVATASYGHDTLFGYKDFFTGLRFEKTVYFRPRRSTEITWVLDPAPPPQQG